MTEKYSTADVRRAWHDATCPEGEECPDREVHALAFESMSVALELFLDYLPDAPAAVVAPKVAPKSSTEPKIGRAHV